MTSELVTGADGLARCGWGAAPPEYRDYHDTEWGHPVRDDVALFERLCLEGFQSGLSWLVILRKRESFRRAFAGFDPQVLAGWGQREAARLLADAGIVRNRAKIAATIRNARAMVALEQPLGELLWSFAPRVRPRPAAFTDVPATTPESKAMAKALKARGFTFVGPTTCYALMQAVGMVDDHLAGCHTARLPAQ